MTAPNVLLLITDQQARATISAYGNERTVTPSMDALTEGGTAFERSYCAAPVCSPGRASILTGRMPHRAGVDTNSLTLRADVPTVGELFRDAGYETAWVGKSHLPDSFPRDADAVRGFDNRAWQQRDRYRDLGADMDSEIVDEAVRWLGEDRDGPFVLGVSLYDPHDICYWIMGRDHDILPTVPDDAALPPLPDNHDATWEEPGFVRWLRGLGRELHDPAGELYGFTELRWTEDWDHLDWRRYLYVYERMVERADRSIGRVLDALEASGHADDTMIVLTSDHGEGMGAHRWVTKDVLYEEPLSVPLIVRYPGAVPAGRVDRTHLASGVDILPTLLDYAGLDVPDDLDGTSLRPVIDDPALPGRGELVAETQPDPLHEELRGRMLRTERYKYVAFSAGDRPERLFDLVADPGEAIDLVDDPAHAEVLADHRDRLARWIHSSGDRFRVGSETLPIAS